jgi:uncharacterized membrane protein YfcA
MQEVLTFAAAVVAGAIASVSGFGIGSILTPLLAAFVGTKLAVALVSAPHFVATALRFATLRQHLDRRVLVSFGIASAAGGVSGGLLHIWLRSAVLGYVLGVLLVFAGLMGVTRRAERLRLTGPLAWIAGGLSGLFGGLVGNQGGIRSAALLGFNVSKETFVATATAIALLVDICRMPVYVATQYRSMAAARGLMLVATAGVVAGTLAGKPLLQRIPATTYLAIVSLIILALGVWMVSHPGA